MPSKYIQRAFIAATIPYLAFSAAVPVSPASQIVYPVAKNSIPIYPPKYSGHGLFSADITVGSQVLRGALDTGSSDTWFLSSDANCTEKFTLQPIPQADCGFSGQRYTVDGDFEVIPDVHLNISYAFGGYIYGPLGYSDFQFGGLSIPKQEFSPAVYGSLGGEVDGNISGIIGLAYPALTTAYPGTDPSQDVPCLANPSDPNCGPVPYSSLMTTIFNQGLSQPFFAFALSRSETDGGVMTIGGIPNLDDERVNVTTGGVATVGVESTGNITDLRFYYIPVDGLQYSGSSPGAVQVKYVVDTGTIPNFVPPKDAQAINALFDPPAVLNETTEVYMVDCNASGPEMSVVMREQVFPVNPKDLILQPYPGVEYCTSAVQTATKLSPPLLGAAFLKSVLAIFDVGGTALTFASRPYYKDS